MKKTKHFQIFVAVIFVSFIVGFFLHFKAIHQAVTVITENKYISYGMSSLVFQYLRGPLQDWLLFIVILTLGFIVLYLGWRYFFSRLLQVKLEFSLKNKKTLKNSVATILTALFLVISEWTVNSQWASIDFSILNVLLNVGVLIITCLVGWVLFNTAWEKHLKKFRRPAKYLYYSSFWVSMVLIMGVAIFLLVGAVKKKPKGPNIIVIVVDCLRADHVGAYGYKRPTSPTIDRVAAKGITFRNAYSAAPWTKPSVASIFTSLYPNRHNTYNAGDYLPAGVLTLAEILKNHGYATCFFNGGNPIISDEYNFYQGFDYFFESEIRATILTEQFLSYLPGLRNGPFFAYIHYMDVHVPYNRNEFNERFTEGKKNYFLVPLNINRDVVRRAAAENALTPGDKQYIIDLYDGQVKFVDDSLNRLFSTLETNYKEILDNTLIILTGDHGEEFWDHDNFEHGHSLYNELLHVPLVLAGGKIKPKEINRPVSLVDIFPTILDRVGVRVPSSLSIAGKHLLKPSQRSIYATGTLYVDEKYAVIKDGVKMIFNTGQTMQKRQILGPTNQEKFEIYRLPGDPGETLNLIDQLVAPHVAELKKQLENFIKAAALVKGKKVSTEQEKNIKEKLKSLGYL